MNLDKEINILNLWLCIDHNGDIFLCKYSLDDNNGNDKNGFFEDVLYGGKRFAIKYSIRVYDLLDKYHINYTSNYSYIELKELYDQLLETLKINFIQTIEKTKNKLKVNKNI